MNVWRSKSKYIEKSVEVEGEYDEERMKEGKEKVKDHVGREW